jgi:heterodisulfide reductase subunit A
MFNTTEKVMEIEDVKCKGCGTCAASCPSCAISQQQFTSEEIFAELEAVLGNVTLPRGGGNHV